MKISGLFFQQKYCFFLKQFNRSACLFFLIALGCLAGCSEEDVEPNHINPISPLPLKIDVTATPPPLATPSAEQNQKNQEAAATPLPTDAPSSKTPTPLLESTPSLRTPTPAVENLSEPPPTPTSLAPKAPAAALAPKTKTTPTPVPVVATPTPLNAPEESEDQTDLENTEETEEQADLENPEEPADLTETEAAPDLKNAQEPNNGLADSKDPKKEARPLVTSDGMTIATLAVCAKIANRTPEECGHEFSLSNTTRIYTWMKLANVKPPKVLKHVYYQDDEFVGTVKLVINHAAMRTWSQKTFNPSDAVGQWKVVLTTDKDKVLAVREFTVVP